MDEFAVLDAPTVDWNVFDNLSTFLIALFVVAVILYAQRQVDQLGDEDKT